MAGDGLMMISARDNVALSLDIHDPGGKVRLQLPEGIDSGAIFSPCQKYRQLLYRRWDSEAARPGYVLWIGMNPSTADGTVDDPTVFKERKYTTRWGYADYRKCNVMDYRATQPSMLLGEGIEPCSEANLPTLLNLASEAALVVLGFGAPHKKLRKYGERVIAELRKLSKPLYCLNVTKDGLPVHPLYQLDSAEPQLYLEDLIRAQGVELEDYLRLALAVLSPFGYGLDGLASSSRVALRFQKPELDRCVELEFSGQSVDVRCQGHEFHETLACRDKAELARFLRSMLPQL